MNDSDNEKTGTQTPPPDHGDKAPWLLIALFLVVQAIIVFGVINPWYDAWRDPLTAFLVIEVIFLIAVFFPLFAYHFFKAKKGLKGSLRASLDSFLDWMGYFTP